MVVLDSRLTLMFNFGSKPQLMLGPEFSETLGLVLEFQYFGCQDQVLDGLGLYRIFKSRPFLVLVSFEILLKTSLGFGLIETFVNIA